uniref:Uncharacterized protein n=1 Tax=Paracidobacterium acidisoli TaxID=2303751 RepID=A0A372IP15_9BACT
MRQNASQNRVSRNLYWIWFAGAAVWFFDAAFGLHRGSLTIGLLDAAVSAVFLAAGMFFRRQARRQKTEDRD